MLEVELKPAIRSKCRGMLSNGVVLKHDNAQPHTAAATVEMIRKLKFRNQHTAQISSHLITIFSEHSKMRYMDADL
jgi:hypothetical protein